MDEEKQTAFAARLTQILNDSALNLGLALGYRLGLFDAMAETLTPMAPGEIAAAANQHPRYVREWLGIMATGRIVEIETDGAGRPLYRLPEEHAAFLTRDSKANMGVYTQEIPLLTDIAMEKVAADFSRALGIPFSAYPRFQDFMGQLSHAKHREVLLAQFLPHVANGELVSRLEKGIRVCDLGCGQGIALHLMADRFPASRFVGIDNHCKAVETAASTAEQKGLSNTEFICLDAAGIKADEGFYQCFDYITAFDAIHDQSRPLAALQGVLHMLAPGGWFSMIDIDAHSSHAGNLDHPMGPFLYGVSLMHCMPVGLNGNGKGLGMMWGRDRAVSLLKEAGFEEIQVLEMPHDPFNVHYFCKV